MNLSTPVVRASLHEELVERLREGIVEGQLAPGHKVPERELCERLGVSRTPLREALKVLAREGLVVLTPNRGATVAPVTLEEMAHLFPVIGALERLAGEAACRLAGDAEIDRIAALHRELFARYEARDREAYQAANLAIHEAIVAAAANPVLAQHYEVLAAGARRARTLANMSDARWAEAVEEHRAIDAALRARDAARLGPLMERHIANKLAALRRAA